MSSKSIKQYVLEVFNRISEITWLSSVIIFLFKPGIIVNNFKRINEEFDITLGLELSNGLKKVLNQRIVLNGPFKGLKFPPVPTLIGHYNYSAQVLGTYEKEIQPCLNEIIEKIGEFQNILNIGSGGGYYAVGLALHSLKDNVVAIDHSDFSNKFLKKVAKLNKVDGKVEVYKSIYELDSKRFKEGRNLWIIDCEGCERNFLLNDSEIFSNSDILVETHEFVHFDIVDEILEKFKPTHEAEVIVNVADMDKVSQYQLPEIDEESRPNRFKLLSEKRNVEMKWIYLKAKKTNVK